MRTLRSLSLIMALAVLGWGSANAVAQDGKPIADKHDTHDLNRGLREVINTGADLFNLHGDYAGCYRLYQGSLLSLKPFLTPELRDKVDMTIKKAEHTPRFSDRAFELRALIDEIRNQTKGPDRTVQDKTVDKTVQDKKSAEKKATPKTLWDRLGGQGGVENIVNEFVLLAGPDPKVNMSRGGKFKLDDKALAHLKKELVAFISNVSGGPISYQGRNMKDVHKGMAITAAEYDATMGHVKGALEKAGVKAAEAKEVLAAVESLRKDIVGDRTTTKTETPPPPLPNDRKSPPPVKNNKKAPPANEATGQLEGKVVVHGKPAPPGFVTFVGEDKRRFSTSIGKDGAYVLKTALPVGKYQIALERVPGAKIPANLDIPERFRSETTSGLFVEVQRGRQNFDLNIAK